MMADGTGMPALPGELEPLHPRDGTFPGARFSPA